MSNRIPSLIAAVAIAAALGATFMYQHERTAAAALREQLMAGELQPIRAILRENQGLIQELQAEPFMEKDSGILESYLAKIRRDGVPKHAEMKQRLDALAENNSAIVTLIKAYAPHAKTHTFTLQADKFRNYASAWRDRWNSVMELFMAGGNYASSSVPFPTAFPAAVDAETEAAK
jgi:hypothetical protein